MTESGLLEHIFERLCRADLGEEIFGADEAADWPAGALDLLIKAGLLRRAEPAQVIECNGCEQYCFMPVHVLPAEGNRPARAFISCDKRDDIGRVPVEMRRLAQWKITGGLLAKARFPASAARGWSRKTLDARHARREGRKLDTQKQYAAWQKSYKELKRNRRGMSVVWYSQQIAKQDIANNRDAETIRKHMKRYWR